MCRGLFQLSLINSQEEEAQKRDLGLSSYKLLLFSKRATSGAVIVFDYKRSPRLVHGRARMDAFEAW